MLEEGVFSFSNFLLDVLVIFLFVVWFWLLISVFSDLFRRHDVSGGAKAVWVIFLIVLPYLGVFVYLITQGHSMSARQQERAVEARDELRRTVGFSVADELGKLEAMKSSGKLSEAEFASLRARLVS